MNKKLEYLKKVSKVNKVELASIEELDALFTEVVNKVADATNEVGNIINELDKPANKLDEATSFYVETVRVLQDIKDAGDELGIDITQNPEISEIVSQLDSYGDAIEQGLEMIASAQNSLDNFWSY